MPKEQRLGYFMNGLNGVIKWQVCTYDPEDLNWAMLLMLHIEKEIHKAYKENFLFQFSTIFVGG